MMYRRYSGMNVAQELENFGVSGPSKIRQILSKTRKANTLINAVKKFQDDNNIKIDSLHSATNLLDLHNIKRRDFHEQVVTDLTDLLLQRIRVLGEESLNKPAATTKLENQLEKCFRLYKLPQFRPVVLETLKQLQKVPDRFLKIIICDKALYEECDITVRQQIWLKNEALFIEAIRPVVESYLLQKKEIEFVIEQSNTNFFTIETTKARRQWKQVQQLIAMVGVREQLYEGLIKFIRDLFISDKNIHLCSLRSELVMAAHDLNIESIVRNDPCHDFVWCLDACVRDKHLDAQQTGKLKGILDGCKKTNIEMIGDLAMVASDVHAVHFLLSMVVKKLRDAHASHLPRDLHTLQLAIRIVSLGSNAQDILSTKNVPTEMIDYILFTKFLPLLESCMVEDAMRLELLRAKVDAVDDITMMNCLSPIPDVLVSFLKANSVTSLLYLHYVLDLLPSKRRLGDVRGLARYMTVVNILRDQLASKGVWCHLFIHRLIYSNQFEPALSDVAIQGLIMDGVLFSQVQDDAVVKYQILRIINQIGFLWGVPICQEMLTRISPEMFSSLSESDLLRYKQDYQKVVDKLSPKPMEVAPAPLLISPPKGVTGLSGMGSPPLPPVRQYPAPMSTPRPSY